ncbi:unnamed protein product [Meganyctiphanes norvegica]|uniref:MARVEL domain-containing protein n=1 Tax=Meganyctiphanes norvegica TaxID=48144 RepID=A0AAV2S7F5_MEGNR
MYQQPTVGFIPTQPQQVTVIQPTQYRGVASSPGIEVCGCTVCPCIHLGFLRSHAGWLKLIELILCAICQSLVLEYGVAYADTIGSSVNTFLTTTSACLLLILLLIFSYIISANSFNLIRASVLEVLFNSVACALYILSSAHLSWGVQTYLAEIYRTKIAFSAYPAMTACYVLGFVAGIVHGIDAFLNQRHRSRLP